MEILQKAAIIAAVIAAVMTGKIEVYQGNDMGAAEKELVIIVDGEIIYPSDEDIIDEKKAGDWVYFRYMLEDDEISISYPALFRYQEGECIAERVNWGSCHTYEVLGDYVYYLNSTTAVKDHGELYVSDPDGKNERKLEEELFDFQIVDEKYIYYTYRHDTVGVGLGAPADGYEKIVCKDIGDNDWIYYVTNRLMKARRDGSEQTELDGVDDYDYHIEKVEDDWIYYTKGGEKYRIRTDGTGKEKM